MLPPLSLLTRIRRTSAMRPGIFLALLLAALGMNAIVPAGHMVAPSTTHFVTIDPCPETNALYRALASAKIHEPAAPTALDHAAMGHHTPPLDDEQPASTASKADCAFSALAFAGMLPEKPVEFASAPGGIGPDARPLPTLALAPVRHLRPPLRAPPQNS